MNEDKLDKELTETIAQLDEDEKSLIFRMMSLMVGSAGFGKAYGALVSERGGPPPRDILCAFMDEWCPTHKTEVPV